MAKKKNKDPLGIRGIAKEMAQAEVIRRNAVSDAELKSKRPVFVQSMVVSNIREDIVNGGKVDTKGWRKSARQALKAVDAAQSRLLEAAVAK